MNETLCPACGRPIDPDERVCPDCDGPPPKPRWSTGRKVIVAVSALIVLSFGACVMCIAGIAHIAPDVEILRAERLRKLAPPSLAASMPGDEAAFCAIVNASGTRAKAAGGLKIPPGKIGELLAERTKALAAYAESSKFEVWVGVLVGRPMPVVGGLDLDIQLPCEARLSARGTKRPEKGGWINDPAPKWIPAISTESPLFEVVRSTKEGDIVRFGGTLLLNIDDKAQPPAGPEPSALQLMDPVIRIQVTSFVRDGKP